MFRLKIGIDITESEHENSLFGEKLIYRYR